MIKLKRSVLILSLLLFCNEFHAQSLNDGYFMARGNLCAVSVYSHDSWSEYWEGKRIRESNFIGTLNTNSVNIMGGWGITDRLLFTVNVPYVWTSSTEYYNSGQSGVQDLGIGLKWKVFKKEIPGGTFTLQPSISGTFPLSDYIPDVGPLSIGNQSMSCTYNLLLDYMMDKDFYFTFFWGYVFRDNIRVDATSYYYNDKLYNTDHMFVPNLIVYGARLGYDVERFRAEGWLNIQNSQGGSDIRRNDRPYPFNRMSFTRAGLAGKYHLKAIPNLSLTASLGWTLSGRNVGKSTIYTAGIQYIFKLY